MIVIDPNTQPPIEHIRAILRNSPGTPIPAWLVKDLVRDYDALATQAQYAAKLSYDLAQRLEHEAQQH